MLERVYAPRLEPLQQFSIHFSRRFSSLVGI
jgi:hypothetical protein